MAFGISTYLNLLLLHVELLLELAGAVQSCGLVHVLG